MNINHILDDFDLNQYKELFKPLYEAAKRVSALKEDVRVSCGDVWDKLGDVLEHGNIDREIVDIIGLSEPAEVIDLFTEARLCWCVCEDYLEDHPLSFTMDIQTYNAINMFVNLSAQGPQLLA